MNYSDTYFELDTLIVTLSVVCTLKGTCEYTLFDVGGVEIHSIHSIECIEYCTKDQSNVKGVEDTLYGFQCIKCYVMLCMLKTSKMVFVTFMQHCIQSNVTHVKGVKYYVMYSVYRGLLPLQGGRLFEKPSVLWV